MMLVLYAYQPRIPPVAEHQQIPYFGTVLTVITIIVQYVAALTAYIATGSQFHGNTVLTQHIYSMCYIM